ncbi:MAG: hypothetical protein IJ371_00320 [Clostridia bacterium]|nr:hypothetical protein [Clostridia bacterium]
MFKPKFRDRIVNAGNKNDCFYTTRIKYYGDDYAKVTCFNRPIFNGDKVELHKSDEELLKPKNDFIGFTEILSVEDLTDVFGGGYVPVKKVREERADSVKRAKDKCFEIAYANNFDWFVTITIDAEKLNRTDTKEILKKCRPLWSNLVQRKEFKYLLIPEYHERYEINGQRAIHFHGLCSGNLNMTESGKVFKGKPIYNWNDWKYGFSTAVPLDNQKFICQYVTKYITKDNNKIFGKYYFSGGQLKRVVPTTYCNINYDDVGNVYGVEPKEVVILENSLKVKYLTLDMGQ